MFLSHISSLDMMPSPEIVFYLTCLFLGKIAQSADMRLSSSPHQDAGFLSANVGDSVTLSCFYEEALPLIVYWYKHTLGHKPKLMSIFYKHGKRASFTAEFENNPHFTLDGKNNELHLTISDLRLSDSATYYCIGSDFFYFDFREGITVHVKGSGLNVPVLVHQSSSEIIQPGGSVTLNCTVHTGTCDGEHSVYWFRHSGESQPGLIYTHRGRNDQSERNNNRQTHTCVYSLAMKNLNHSGTFHCAVASCGHIMFNGTKVEFENDDDSLVLVYFLSGASAFTGILGICLAFLVCLMTHRHGCLCEESEERFSAPSTTKDYQNENDCCGSALWEKKLTRRRRQRQDTWSECVYYSVKH